MAAFMKPFLDCARGRSRVEITEVVERPGRRFQEREFLRDSSEKSLDALQSSLNFHTHVFTIMTVTARSFAKINLGLRIGAAREDGFHELLTVYQTIALHDVIRMSVGRGSGVEVRCEDPRVPRDESNTCWRIVERALEVLKTRARVVIEIEKRLPVQGGLGGASANAVACLIALERALKKELPKTERFRIAAEVGSDLPLFLVGGTVLGVGRGEQVYPLQDLPAMACVVVTPDVGVSTPNAFAEWDRRQGLKPYSQTTLDAALKRRSSTKGSASEENGPSDNGPSDNGPSDKGASEEGASEKGACEKQACENPAEPHPAVPAKSAGKLTVSGGSDRMNELSRELSAWLGGLYSGAPSDRSRRRGRAENPLLALVRAGIENDGIENDFERVVFPEYPELGEGKRALLRAGAKYASLSGSGSTLYGLFGSRAAAVKAVARLRKEGWAAQATATLPRSAYWRKALV
jgi:4-diphosphocytidyl-2-C-methyl-D-erythritol kinase